MFSSRSSSSYSDDKYGKYNFSSDLSLRNRSLQRVLNSEYGRRDRSSSPSRDYSSTRLFNQLPSTSPSIRRDASPSHLGNGDLGFSTKPRNYYDFSSTGIYSSYSSTIKKPRRTDYLDYLVPVVLNTRPMLKTDYVPRSRAERDHDSNPISRDRRLIKFRETSDEVLEKIRRKISWDLPEEISSPLIDEMKNNADFSDMSQSEPVRSRESSSRRGSKDISGSPRPPTSRRSSREHSLEKSGKPPRKNSRANSLIASTVDDIHDHLDSKSEDANRHPKAPIPPPRKKSLGTVHKLKPRKSSIEILLSEEKTQNYSKIAADIRRNREITVESLKKMADESMKAEEDEAEEAEQSNADQSAETVPDRSRRRRRRVSTLENEQSEEIPPVVRRRRQSRIHSLESNESISPSADSKHASEDKFSNEAPQPVSRMHRKSVKYKPDGLPPTRSSKESSFLQKEIQLAKVQSMESAAKPSVKKTGKETTAEDKENKEKRVADTEHEKHTKKVITENKDRNFKKLPDKVLRSQSPNDVCEDKVFKSDTKNTLNSKILPTCVKVSESKSLNSDNKLEKTTFNKIPENKEKELKDYKKEELTHVKSNFSTPQMVEKPLLKEKKTVGDALTIEGTQPKKNLKPVLEIKTEKPPAVKMSEKSTEKAPSTTIVPISKSSSKEGEEIVIVCKLPQPKKDFGLVKKSIPSEQKVVVSIKSPEPNAAQEKGKIIPTGRSVDVIREVPDVNVTHTVVLKPKPQNEASRTAKDSVHLEVIPDVIKNTVNCAMKGSDDTSDIVKSTLSKNDQPKTKKSLLPSNKEQALDKCDKTAEILPDKIPPIKQKVDKIPDIKEVSNQNTLAPKELSTTKSLLTIQKSNSDDLKEKITDKISSNIKKSSSDVFHNAEGKSGVKPDLIQMTTKITENVIKPPAIASQDALNKQFKENNSKIPNDSKPDKMTSDVIQLKPKIGDKDVLVLSSNDPKVLSDKLGAIKGNELRDNLEKIETSKIKESQKCDLKGIKLDSTAVSLPTVSEKLPLNFKKSDEICDKETKSTGKKEIQENVDSKQDVNGETSKNKKALPELEVCVKKGAKDVENKVPDKMLTIVEDEGKMKKSKPVTQACKKSVTVSDVNALLNSSQEKITNIQKDTSLSADNVPEAIEAFQLPQIKSFQETKLCKESDSSNSKNKSLDKIEVNLDSKLKSEVKTKDALIISKKAATLPLLSTTKVPSITNSEPGNENSFQKTKEASLPPSITEDASIKTSLTTKDKYSKESKLEKLPPVNEVPKHTANLSQENVDIPEEISNLDKLQIDNNIPAKNAAPVSTLDEENKKKTESVIEPKIEKSVTKPASNAETKSQELQNLNSSPVLEKELVHKNKTESTTVSPSPILEKELVHKNKTESTTVPPSPILEKELVHKNKTEPTTVPSSPVVEKEILHKNKTESTTVPPKQTSGEIKVTKESLKTKSNTDNRSRLPPLRKPPKIPEYKRYGLFIKPKEPQRKMYSSSSSDDSSEESETETEESSSSDGETAPVSNGKCPDQNERVRTRSATSTTSITSNGSNCTTYTTVTSDDENSSPKRRTSLRFRKYTIEDFVFLKLLGKGSFGKVLLAELKDANMYFAIKCLKKDVVLEDDDVESTMIERRVLALGTQHPYMCKLYCTFQSESYLYFVMEYLNGGDLMFHIQETGRFEEKRAMFYGAEIVSALKFLHKRGIVYRDIKLDNIVLDEQGHIRLVDFGMCQCRIYKEECMPSNFCGTPTYIAPEIVMGKTYNESVDWWSFGVLLYEMLIGRSPFQGTDEDELFWSICNEEPAYPRFLSKEATHILGLLLVKAPMKRLGMPTCAAGDIQDHAFFSSIDWEKIESKQVPPVFKPKVSSAFDTSNFDRSFTMDSPSLDLIDSNVLKSIDQEQFNGFSYTNPHLIG